MKKILVLEDEENIRSFVVINLKRAGYETVEAGTGEEALAQLKQNPGIRVALLDIMLPDIDGFEVCRRIRAMDNKIGIIMLTARTQEMDKVTGLMTGADDYVTKPFSPAELTARVDALFRRTGGDEELEADDEVVQPPFRLNTRNRTLEKNGQRVKLTQVEYGIVKLFMENPDVKVALLDIMLPGIDGFEVCRRIRAMDNKIGIIMLTARTQEMDKVTGFMTGADDYVTKPFSPAELTARIDALYRRIGGDVSDDGVISQPPFVLNTRRRSLEKHGQRIKLTQVEYAIIKLFMENPGKALAREEILHMVWGEGYLGELKIVDINIRRLRVKIEDEPTSPTFITTIWGYGYKWEV